jgi:hypothetical protein
LRSVPPGTVTLGVYNIKAGNLTSEWWPADGDVNGKGAEELSGSPKLAGAYKIVSGKAVKTGVAYNSGTVTLAPVPNVNVGGDPCLTLAWKIGTYQAGGIAFKAGDALVVASGAKDYAIVRLKLDSANLIGDFFASNMTTGFYTLGHDN